MQEGRLRDAVMLAAELDHSHGGVVREHLVESKLVAQPECGEILETLETQGMISRCRRKCVGIRLCYASLDDGSRL